MQIQNISNTIKEFIDLVEHVEKNNIFLKKYKNSKNNFKIELLIESSILRELLSKNLFMFASEKLKLYQSLNLINCSSKRNFTRTRKVGDKKTRVFSINYDSYLTLKKYIE